ncbi:unnamed protein product [Caenorhabditis bovis]|uniref:Uncharacterized protein n=1 Tax=Caenorhabditis bovis TaxID=2654633 RepID=A0A8S1FB61_9PELO|nr:unnamed protein product [Caenorhabditis bovis]
MLIIRQFVPNYGIDDRFFPRNLLENPRKLNEYRANLAQSIIKSHKKPENLVTNHLEIRVVASNRGEFYLLQTIGFILEQQPIGAFNLSICNVEIDIFDDLAQFEQISIPILSINNGTKKALILDETIRKETIDYWHCLAQKSRSRYILLIEDDSIIIGQFTELINSLIRHLDYADHIDYVKLYHPIKLRKLPSYFLFPCQLRYYITGSAYISYPESCCTPAVIFRTSQIPKMIEHFNKQPSYAGHAKDHILDDSPFIGRQSDLNYVIHIGSFSSIRRRTVQLSDLRDFGIA